MFGVIKMIKNVLQYLEASATNHQVVNWNKDETLSFALPKVAKGSDLKIMVMAKPAGDSKTPPAFQVYPLK